MFSLGDRVRVVGSVTAKDFEGQSLVDYLEDVLVGNDWPRPPAFLYRIDEVFADVLFADARRF